MHFSGFAFSAPKKQLHHSDDRKEKKTYLQLEVVARHTLLDEKHQTTSKEKSEWCLKFTNLRACALRNANIMLMFAKITADMNSSTKLALALIWSKVPTKAVVAFSYL